MSFSPKEIAAEIKKHIPDLQFPINLITGRPLPTAGRKVLMTVLQEKTGDGKKNLIWQR